MKLLFTGIFIVVIASVYVIRQAGYNPKPILTMKASKYESALIVGNGLFRRFFKEAQNIKDFYIFCEPDQCSKLEMWIHFLNQAKNHKLENRKIVVDEQLAFNYISSDSDRGIYFYPLHMENKISIPSKNSIIFYMADFFVNRSEENNPNCENVDKFKDLDCLAIKYSRKFYKKKYDPKNRHVGMEQISHNKYVIYLN